MLRGILVRDEERQDEPVSISNEKGNRMYVSRAKEDQHLQGSVASWNCRYNIVETRRYNMRELAVNGVSNARSAAVRALAHMNLRT